MPEIKLYGWRKAAVWAVVFVFACVALGLGWLDQNIWFHTVSWVTGFFFTSNAAEHFANRK